MYLSSIGKHEDRLRNLFFLYAVVLRAVNRAEPILKAYDYDTHLNLTEDEQTPELLDSLLKMSLSSCEEPFKENSLFRMVDNDFRQELLFKEL
jgi:ERO1-like protein alpha